MASKAYYPVSLVKKNRQSIEATCCVRGARVAEAEG